MHRQEAKGRGGGGEEGKGGKRREREGKREEMKNDGEGKRM